jgi:hypothetical protein
MVDLESFDGVLTYIKHGQKSSGAYNIHQGPANGVRHRAGILPKPFQYIHVNYLIPKTNLALEYKYVGNAGLTINQFKKLALTSKIKYTGPLVHGFTELDKKHITLYRFTLPVYVIRYISYWKSESRPKIPKAGFNQKFLHNQKLRLVKHSIDIDSYSLTPTYIIKLNLRSYENKIIKAYKELKTG